MTLIRPYDPFSGHEQPSPVPNTDPPPTAQEPSKEPPARPVRRNPRKRRTAKVAKPTGHAELDEALAELNRGT